MTKSTITPNQNYEDLILCQQSNKNKQIGNDKAMSFTKLKIQPNPTSDFLEVLVNSTPDINETSLSIKIYNNVGQLMLEREAKYRIQEEFDVSSFEAGIYTVIIESKAGVLLHASKVIVFNQ